MSDLPSDSEIARINAEHLISTPIRSADLLFIFGTRHGVGETVQAALGLWSRGFFRHAIVSGGLTAGDTRTECAIIKQAMVAGGVPEALILEEHRATNIGENVIFSLPVIDAALGRENIGSVICLGKICTARRYPMTLHRHWPEVEKMLLTINPYGAPIERWHTDALFRERVLLEWRKIEPYKNRGFIADWP
ncbi:YdcF family protein [uncultured Reyranella sp.]|uniref:YdcF family protein n=1 Tax=uncultured Reyranella sp. TaxID=735512 RepID=UPI0025E5E214|nr:YdcF family protein [uncultured Reyranella sp.]